MDEKHDEANFEKHAEKTGKRILKESESVLVVHHYDCDGIASAGVVSQALNEEAIASRSLVAKRIDENILAEIAKAEEKTIVITDLASSTLQETADALENKIIFVIDHHPPKEFEAENVSTVNPHDFGLDGAIELSAASAAYYCFKHLQSQRIAQLGIVGAVGDMQDQDGFVGLNKKMAKEAEEDKFVFVNRDLRLFGRVSRPLVWFLAYCDEPFIPGLSGNEKACALFLNKLGLPLKTNDRWTTYYDLNVFDRRKLSSALINLCLEKGIEKDAVERMVGDVFLFLNEPEKSELRDAYEFSTLLNACGRHDQAALGVGVCLHEQGAYEKAKAILIEHRRAISQGIWFAKKHASDLGAFYFFDARGKVSDTVIGTVAGSLFASGLFERNKPVIAFSTDEEGNTKISSRGSKYLAKRGLDLGEAMRKAGEASGGEGGGHNVAAGCTIPPTKEAEMKFLKKAKEVIEIQLQLKP